MLHNQDIIKYLKSGNGKSAIMVMIDELNSDDTIELAKFLSDYFEFDLQGPFIQYQIFPLTGAPLITAMLKASPIAFFLFALVLSLLPKEKLGAIVVGIAAGMYFLNTHNSSRSQFADMTERLFELLTILNNSSKDLTSGVTGLQIQENLVTELPQPSGSGMWASKQPGIKSEESSDDEKSSNQNAIH